MFEDVSSRQKFEKAGLKLDRERVLTYSKLSCPYECAYCFVEDMNFNQERDVAYLSPEQYVLLEQLPEEINLVMLGCDTEFFQSKRNALEILRRLSDLKKDISVVTRSPLTPNYVEQLKEVDEKLHQKNNSLFFSISLPCFDSAKKWEPKAPPPESRIETLAKVQESGINTLVAIRPLLPTVSIEELEKIVTLTKNSTGGYYSGPLYLKNLRHSLLTQEQIADLKIERLQPHWMPEENIFYSIEKEGQMELLRKLVEDNGKLLFEGAANAIKYLKDHEKY